MTSIVHLGSYDLLLTKECAFGFFEESSLPGEMNFEYWKSQWEQFINGGFGTIIAYFVQGRIVGVIGGLAHPCTMTGDMETVEAFWYVLPEHRKGTYGIKLLQSFEDWSRLKQAKRIKMIHMSHINPESMASIYKRLNYREIEVGYLKEL